MKDTKADSYQGIDEKLVRLRRIADQSYSEGSMTGMIYRCTLHTDQLSLAWKVPP